MVHATAVHLKEPANFLIAEVFAPSLLQQRLKAGLVYGPVPVLTDSTPPEDYRPAGTACWLCFQASSRRRISSCLLEGAGTGAGALGCAGTTDLPGIMPDCFRNSASRCFPSGVRGVLFPRSTSKISSDGFSRRSFSRYTSSLLDILLISTRKAKGWVFSQADLIRYETFWYWFHFSLSCPVSVGAIPSW